MNQYQTERKLCLSYSLIAVFHLISVISIGIPYNHWKTTLDVCPGSYLENTNCGCIFYGVSTFQYFNGGHNSKCLYAVFAPLVAIVYAIVMAVFHMYRVCISNVGQFEDEKSTAMEQIEGEAIVVTTRSRVTHKNDAVIFCWIPNACIAFIFVLYCIVHSSIVTDGFIKTCNQYRSHLVRQLQANGDHASLIHFRLSCSSIYDFMDYMQKNSLNNRHGDFINTGASLQIAIVSSWFAVVIWIYVIVLTVRRAYRERDVMTCCEN